jgi:hypothetical protein
MWFCHICPLSIVWQYGTDALSRGIDGWRVYAYESWEARGLSDPVRCIVYYFSYSLVNPFALCAVEVTYIARRTYEYSVPHVYSCWLYWRAVFVHCQHETWRLTSVWCISGPCFLRCLLIVHASRMELCYGCNVGLNPVCGRQNTPGGFR